MLKELLLVAFSVLLPTHLCIPNIKLERDVELPEKDFTTNDTQVTNEGEENNASSTANDSLFWALPHAENTTGTVGDEQNDVSQSVKPEESFVTEESVLEQSTNGTSEVKEPSVSADESISEEKNEVSQQASNESSQTNDIIILHRKNCHAEIAVHENTDTKLTIKFDRLQNDSYGRCCITLTGHRNNALGVLISNIHLYRNNTQGEVLKVIVGERYSTFTLKEYYGENGYEPLLLTETHKVYLVLYYKVENVGLNHDCTHFDLEVFTYHKPENNIHHHHKNDYSSLHEENAYFMPYIIGRV